MALKGLIFISGRGSAVSSVQEWISGNIRVSMVVCAMHTLVHVYVDLVVFTRIAGTS